MEKNISKQKEFFNKIEDIIPTNTSLVNELIDSLDLSMDSAYRRLRGDTSLTLDEIVLLCNKYKISFDSFINIESGNVTFNYNNMANKVESFTKYMQSTLQDLTTIHTAKQKQIIYACEDIPIFYNMYFSDIAAFKMFYWMKSILNVEELEGEKFDTNKLSDEIKEMGKKVFELYTEIPSIEIWTDTTIHSTVKQIRFYWASGMFASKDDALKVCTSLKEEITVIQKQAEAGSKILLPGRDTIYNNNYELYFSEIEITNNTVLVRLGETKVVFLGHHTFNTMSTSNRTYCNETEAWLENIIKKSTPLSGVSEKHRYQFFKNSFAAIDEMVNEIKND